MALLDNLLGSFRRTRVRPTETIGRIGTAIYGGYIQRDETSRDLASTDARYRTFSDILANTSIVAAGVRYFLNMIGRAEWTFTPSEADTDGQYAEMVEEMLTYDPATPWHRIVRRAALYRFYGFGIQEWTAKRHTDGHLTFQDVAPRAQSTIERWDLESDGTVLGALQRSPQTQEEIYLPRQKLLYIVDDSLNDSPEGLGLFRHLVAPARRLKRYEQLEGFGFETDLRGIPIGYAPLEAIEANPNLTAEEKKAAVQGFVKFLTDHVKTPDLSLLLDSKTYLGQDDAQRPSNVKHWSVELLEGNARSFAENAAAIERLNRELARILGVEQLLLGSGNTGSLALSRDKTHTFYLLVEGSLIEIRESIEADLLGMAWTLNGWPEEMMPEVSAQPVQFREIEGQMAGLRDLATATGPVTDPTVINEALDLLGFSPIDVEAMQAAEEDVSLLGGEPANEEEPVPASDEETE